ncbi:ABC transporter ATP-binding protein [Galbibacter pacificus]|uniref:ABC transporter ATP-binding protein n=1 Tax=Galbibacter pacificus TaxID=2996052 RepID=A0ABT6FU77_9FLAO|nr:ABC transporter ATP-binding protein [Galbibacter pacificus]MDG3583336.1 ABC transporter ATP-binding protein [Galbibacter pacificus]MDG3586817.1 ABC transporter ATP-binding protein [Galbibacter pacificus]
MIVTENLSKAYNGTTVLNVGALEVPTGQAFGLVGNNGAGKTTFFSLLLDLVQPTSGHITNNGIQVNTSEEWKPFTSAFIDETFLIGYLTPEEYFYFIGELRGLNKEDVNVFLNGFADFFHGEILGGKKYLRDLSKGNQKKAGIVAAFIGKPKVIVLDEPFANLDPTTQIRLKKIISAYKENDAVTVLISSHDLLHVTEVCERIVVLDKGAVVKDIKTSRATLQELEGFFAEEILNVPGED